MAWPGEEPAEAPVDPQLARALLERRKKARPLLRALQLLYQFQSADACAATLTLETEDEKALKDLQRNSEDFLPALAVIRSNAADREALAHLGNPTGPEDE